MWYYILSLAACAVSLLAKPTSVAMPLLLLLLDFWPLRRISIRALLEKLPWFIIAVVSAVITFISQSSSSTARLPEKSGVMKILLTICHNIVFYLYNLVWPANISWYYPFPEPFEVQNPAVITGLVGTAVLLIALAVSLRRTRSMATGWSFFFLAVFPTLGIVGFHPVIAADRHIYFPTTGLLLPLTVGLTALWQRPAGPISKKAVRTVSLAAVILLTASEFILTRCYLVHWQTSENIYRYMLDYSPNIAILHNNLANILSDSGDPRTITQAVRHFETSLKLEPGSPEVHNNLGNALSKLGKNDEAIIEYKKALALRPSFAVAHYNLARTLAELGRTTDAVAEYNQAVKLKPDYVDAWSNLGFLLAAKADYEQAIQCYNTALRNEPDSVIVHGRLGLALAATGKIDQAIDQFRIVLNALPNDQQMHFNLAYLLEKKGQFDQAIEHYRRALEIDPGYAEARQRLEMLQKNRMPH
jgi:Flp pilus assembly protein TadD